MKLWTKQLLIAASALTLAACANMGKQATPGVKEKPVLPAEYAAALDLLQREQWAAAETALLNYATANPGMSSPQVNLALLYKRSDRPDQAKAALAKALSINPKQAAAHNQLGIFAREAGDFQAARDAYETAIDADPGYPNAHLNLAILLDLYLHEPRKALRHYQHYADLIGEDALDQAVKSWIAETQRRVENGA